MPGKTTKDRFFDPTRSVREDLARAQAELVDARAVVVAIEQRITGLEALLERASDLGLSEDGAPLTLLPFRPKGAEPTQWDWVQRVLQRHAAPLGLKAIADAVQDDGGPSIARTSLSHLLSVKAEAGEVQHIGRAWRLRTSR